jgi:hypothetical protein
MTQQQPNYEAFGFFRYKTGSITSAEEISFLHAQQEIMHSDISFIFGWLFIGACLIGGVFLGLAYKDETIKTGGFGLAGASLGAVIQSQASKASKSKDKNI